MKGKGKGKRERDDSCTAEASGNEEIPATEAGRYGAVVDLTSSTPAFCSTSGVGRGVFSAATYLNLFPYQGPSMRRSKLHVRRGGLLAMMALDKAGNAADSTPGFCQWDGLPPRTGNNEGYQPPLDPRVAALDGHANPGEEESMEDAFRTRLAFELSYLSLLRQNGVESVRGALHSDYFQQVALCIGNLADRLISGGLAEAATGMDESFPAMARELETSLRGLILTEPLGGDWPIWVRLLRQLAGSIRHMATWINEGQNRSAHDAQGHGGLQHESQADDAWLGEAAIPVDGGFDGAEGGEGMDEGEQWGVDASGFAQHGAEEEEEGESESTTPGEESGEEVDEEGSRDAQPDLGVEGQDLDEALGAELGEGMGDVVKAIKAKRIKVLWKEKRQCLTKMWQQRRFRAKRRGEEEERKEAERRALGLPPLTRAEKKAAKAKHKKQRAGNRKRDKENVKKHREKAVDSIVEELKGALTLKRAEQNGDEGIHVQQPEQADEEEIKSVAERIEARARDCVRPELLLYVKKMNQRARDVLI